MAIVDDPYGIPDVPQASRGISGGSRGWSHLPYSYEQGSSYGQAPGGGSSLAPAGASLYAPSQAAPPPSPAAPTAAVPPAQRYTFGTEGDPDAGRESQSFASALGQGVLAASQQAAAMAAAQANKKKQQGGPGGGQMGGGGGGGLGAGFGSGGVMGGEV